MPYEFPFPPFQGDEVITCDGTDFGNYNQAFMDSDLMKNVFNQRVYYSAQNPKIRERLACFFSINAIYRCLFGKNYGGTIPPDIKGVVLHFGEDSGLHLIASSSDKYTHVIGENGYVDDSFSLSVWDPTIESLVANFIYQDRGYKALGGPNEVRFEIAKQSLLRLLNITNATLQGSLRFWPVLHDIDNKPYFNLAISGVTNGEYFLGLPHPPRYLDTFIATD